MDKNRKSTIWTLTLIFIGLFIATRAMAQVEVEKVINQSYAVSANTSVDLQNRFGEVNVSTGNFDRIEVEVKMTAWGNNQSKAENMLSMISIDYGTRGDQIYFKTSISSRSINISDRNGFKIDYNVKMPADKALSLSNKYGETYVANFSGPLTIDCAYGGLHAEKLSGNNAKVSVRYGSANIALLQNGKLDLAYSSKVYVDEIGDIRFSNKYGGIEIGRLGSLIGSSKYSKFYVEELTGMLDLEVKYGNADIDLVHQSTETLYLDLGYSNANIRFDREMGYQFEVSTRYGNFKNNLSESDLNYAVANGNSASYRGQVSGAGAGTKVNITASYGNVKFR